MLEVFRIHALYCGLNQDNVSNRDCLMFTKEGVLDDYHNDNKILMLDLDSYNQMHDKNALCMKSFYANIIVEKLADIQLSETDTFHTNELVLKIRHIGKRCHISDGCQYLSNNNNCPLKNNTIYLECINPGLVKVDDLWEVTQCIDTP